MIRWLKIAGFVAAVVTAVPFPARAQDIRGIVVDQTGLPLPGTTVQLRNGETVVATTSTRGDGTFAFDGGLRGATITAALDGFETGVVSAADAARIVLSIAHATETTTVVAPTFVQESPTTATLGAHLTAQTLARLPSNRLKAKESLPLLPSVVRGADGLLRVGGARPYETPLLVDGFNVSDPATGISNINLPFESVRGVEVLRDPVSVTYGGLVGGLMQLDSKPGSDQFKIGAQGFVPRPRFTTPGFGRLEGIFPRVYVSGPAAQGQIRYFASVEYDFERIPVPGVTRGTGPDIVEQSATIFGRADLQVSTRQALTVEALAFPASTRSAGLSPRRDAPATANNRSVDLFAGVTDRVVLNGANVLTVRAGVVAHETTLVPNGTGAAHLSPAGWRGNWYAAIARRAVRYVATAGWDRTKATRRGTHTLTIGGSIAARRMSGSLTENSVSVENAEGRVVRAIDFGDGSSIRGRDARLGAWVRDVWRASDRVEIDGGVRIDSNTGIDDTVPSVRAGIRYALDASQLTVLKAGAGSFVGMLPLAVQAFAGYPNRLDRSFDSESGSMIRELHLQPAVENLRLPHAVAASVQIEHQFSANLDAQVGITARRSDRLATLHVPIEGGLMPVRSNGRSTYHELLVSVRQTWNNDQQLFLSYVRSTARGELNDFVALFQTLDAPLLQPGGMSRTSADARNRWIAWGTANFPHRIVVSPVVEVRSGFPYSVLDQRYGYFDRPNGSEFPVFMAMDLVAYKTVTVKKRSADVGIQLFNATNHFNPRDVYAVAGAPRSGDFTNSVGPILRGFLMLKW